MTLLALETAADTCGVALLRGAHVEVELALRRPRAHAEHLAPMVQQALALAGLTLADVAAVAVSMGPGSYTGLRIGVSTAKGLCVAGGAALVGVPSLEALAEQAAPVAADGDYVLAAANSRRDEVYAAAYALRDGRPEPLVPTAALATADVPGWLPEVPRGATCWVVGPGAARAARALEVAGRPFRTLPPSVIGPSAAAVARLGRRRLEAGQTEDVAAFEPFYLKEFVAQKPQRSIFERLPPSG